MRLHNRIFSVATGLGKPIHSGPEWSLHVHDFISSSVVVRDGGANDLNKLIVTNHASLLDVGLVEDLVN